MTSQFQYVGLERRATAVRLEPGELPADALVEARQQLHHAAQLVAAAGRSYVEPRDDDAHATLGWNHELKALVSLPLSSGASTLGVALLVERAALAVLDAQGRLVRALPVVERVRPELAGWVRAQIAILGLPAARYQFATPYELPEHPVAGRRRYLLQHPEDWPELARWFALGQRLLDHWRERLPGADAVRCWPDRLELRFQAPLESGRRLQLGFSPGDEAIDEPYVSVRVLPEPPAVQALGALACEGHWQEGRWTGACLRGSTLLRARPPLLERASEFVGSAVAALSRLPAG